MRFQDRIRQFMYGRYGVDNLYRFLFGTYLVLWFLNLFLHNAIIGALSLVVAFILIYRAFSRNIPKRQAENAKYMELKSKLFRRSNKAATRDAYHLYKKCHKCNTTLRLPIPSKKGFKTATCPRCGNDVKFFTMKSVKIEVVK